MPATSATVPWVNAVGVTAVTVSVSFSTSVSLTVRSVSGKTSATSSFVVLASATAIGASLTAETVTATEAVLVPPFPSETVYSKLAGPFRFAVGVKVTTPAVTVALPPTGAATAVTISVSPSTSVSLAARFGRSAGVSSVAVRTSATATGASLTAVTLSETVPVSVSAPSETV